MSDKTPAQRNAKATAMRRYRAKRALREGKTYTPKKHTPGLPAGVDRKHLDNVAPPLDETPKQRQRRRWREIYEAQALANNGSYTPRIPIHQQDAVLHQNDVRVRMQRLKELIDKNNDND